MLFNSHIFIFVFLPIVWFGFYRIADSSQARAALWLASASLFFYAWWDIRFLWLLSTSIVFNYAAGFYLAKTHKNFRKWLLISAIAINLSLLAYFKYANFFLETLNTLFTTDFEIGQFLLPLGISFFTFTQIAFLVDTYQNKVKELNFIHYILFVTYFPHLIAGPVLHHGEMMPQFAKSETYRFSYDHVMVGLVIFFMGLFKKVVLADSIAHYANPVFAAPTHLSYLEAWMGALSYSLQLYFDFSGYSDMAIGLSRLFGITLPLNFHSPYKSVNIIEFWRHWHMTLSRFLRDYLYIPLGGNRYGTIRRYSNLFLTMLLGGLWHGAGWTFVLWGGLHGFYLMVNHGWHALRRYFGQNPQAVLSKPAHIAATLLTFLSVLIAWVIFRADNVNNAFAILKAMAGFNGFALPIDWLSAWGTFGQFLINLGIQSDTNSMLKATAFNWIALGLAIVWFAPNTQQIMTNYQPALVVPNSKPISRYFIWQPSMSWLVISILVSLFAILSISKLSEFIYFQF